MGWWTRWRTAVRRARWSQPSARGAAAAAAAQDAAALAAGSPLAVALFSLGTLVGHGALAQGALEAGLAAALADVDAAADAARAGDAPAARYGDRVRSKLRAARA